MTHTLKAKSELKKINTNWNTYLALNVSNVNDESQRIQSLNTSRIMNEFISVLARAVRSNLTLQSGLFSG